MNSLTDIGPEAIRALAKHIEANKDAIEPHSRAIGAVKYVRDAIRDKDGRAALAGFLALLEASGNEDVARQIRVMNDQTTFKELDHARRKSSATAQDLMLAIEIRQTKRLLKGVLS